MSRFHRINFWFHQISDLFCFGPVNNELQTLFHKRVVKFVNRCFKSKQSFATSNVWKFDHFLDRPVQIRLFIWHQHFHDLRKSLDVRHRIGRQNSSNHAAKDDYGNFTVQKHRYAGTLQNQGQHDTDCPKNKPYYQKYIHFVPSVTNCYICTHLLYR